VSEESPSASVSQLTTEERDRLVALLAGKGGPKTCELCGAAEWQMGEHLVSPLIVNRIETGIRMDLTGRVHTSALLICKNCGNTKFLNLNVLGGRFLLPVATR
jgi:hypothetical protein